MLADEATGIATGGTGFGTEAGRVGGELVGQLVAVEDVVTEHVGDGDLRGRDEEQVVCGLEGVLLELRQLAGTGHGCAIDEERREDFRITVFGVGVQVVVDDGALESGAGAFVEMEAGSGDFRGGLRVQDAEVSTEVPVRFGFEAEVFRLAPAADLNVFGVILADRDALVRNVRDAEDDLLLTVCERRELLVVRLDLGLDLAHLGEDLGGVSPGLLDLGDLLGSFVLLLFQFVVLLLQRAALRVDGDELVDFRIQVAVAGLDRSFDALRVFSDDFDVQHCDWSPLC